MTRDDVEQIIAWRYPGDYAFYDMSRDEEGRAEFRDPQRWRIVPLDQTSEVLVAVTDAAGRLCGDFLYKGTPELCVVGLGMAPELTGKGLGLSFVEAGLEFGERTWDVRAYFLIVASFNERARIVYERARFRETSRSMRDVFGEQVEFVEMRRG